MMTYSLNAIAPLLALFISTVAIGCTTQPSAPPDPVAAPESSASTDSAVPTDVAAIVTAVAATPQADAGYTFAVTVQSPDTGCDQYANWWEVISAEGDLLYRRILAHSHVDEQPFERSGGPVAIAPTQTVIVRAHMHPDGYSTQAMQGNPEDSFQTVTLTADFAADVATAEPQPDGCTF